MINRWVTSFVLLGVLMTLCGCQSTQTQAQQALTRQLQARQKAQRQADALYGQAIKKHEESKFEEALDLLQKAVQTDTKHLKSWLALGAFEMEQKDYAEAEKAFREAYEVAPNRHEAQYNLGVLYETVLHYDQAVKAYETALNVAPNDLHIIENLARTYIKADHDLPKAYELLQKAKPREFREDWRKWLYEQIRALKQRTGNGDLPA
ncbi:MAG: hypothetical protein CMJ19_11380 [Phycisphaeraceae bacterium]|nr:hypothetical protein [Phycisphaeraceae bacterium]|tara:strand:- start:1080 stop:1700 length:621 start_codon:yes stop_codon:yes gene_type:complete